MTLMFYTNKRWLYWLGTAILFLALGGCARRSVDMEIPIDVPDTFSFKGTDSAPDQWWLAFEDTDLDTLIEQSLQRNLDLLAAWDRLDQARAAAQKVDSTLWPWINGQAGVSRRRLETGGRVDYSTTYSMGLAAGYEVDLWSQLESAQQAAWLSVEAQQEAVHTMAISLAASVADTWYQLAEAKALDRLTQEQIVTNQQVLQIVTTQFRKGGASAADVLRQRQLVAATEALKIVVKETMHLLQHRLSILIGMPPSLAWQNKDVSFPPLRPLPDPGIPSDVLWRRPDVRGGYRQVQAADYRLAAAIADQYPSLSLSGTMETTAPSIHDLFDDWLANLIANAVQPLMDAGLRKAEVRRQQALRSESLHLWQQIVLDSLKEVEDTLVQEQYLKQTLDNLKQQLGLARRTSEQNRERYIKGQIDYIRVLESLQSLQSLERNVILARSQVVRNRIALYRSLAGGWDLVRPENDETSLTASSLKDDKNTAENAKERL
ncbi:MAG: efflux transporter outer membrane subunit [Sedimentisphaerales bacterium]|nr:efflux transporter outer membrane subunit [Sedimentisphaerales bacterium]